MNADACDLKTAYVQFTRAAVILAEVIPNADGYSSYQMQYELLEDVYAPSTSSDNRKSSLLLWWNLTSSGSYLYSEKLSMLHVTNPTTHTWKASNLIHTILLPPVLLHFSILNLLHRISKQCCILRTSSSHSSFLRT